MKKIISSLLTITLLVSVLLIDDFCTYASNNDNYINSSYYTGTYASSSPMEFTINTVNMESGTFSGHVVIDDPLTSVDKNITGSITFNSNSITCSFSFDLYWIYSAAFNLTINTFTGVVTGTGGGGLLLAGDVNLTGTIHTYYNQLLSYSENDMKMCMDLSNAIYDKSENKLDSSLNRYENLEYCYQDTKRFNNDSNPNNVMFSLLKRTSNDSNKIDIIVVIRGTYNEEWQGNVNIADLSEVMGTNYNSVVNRHYNFNLAKESIKDKIIEAYTDIENDYNEINLIVTGHSRGAAVANLYAKDATDVKNRLTVGEDVEKIPQFDNVTAYTFACPNVARI